MFKSLKGFLASSTLSPNSQVDASSTNESPESTSTNNSSNPEGKINSANTTSEGTPISNEGSSLPPQSMTESMYNDAAMLSDELKKSLNTAKGYLWNWGSSASKVATKAVKDVPILGDFQKEQDAFEQSRHSDDQPRSPPWVGFPNEEALRKQIVALSDEERNFLRNPPSGIQFTFDLKANTQLALLMMREDPKLSTMRFKLVPKRVKEDIFWRNYFYRVSLIKQSASLSTFAKQHSLSSTPPVPTPSTPTRPLSPAETLAPTRASAATNSLELGLGGQSVDADQEADAEMAALSGSGSPGASAAPVSLPPEELAQLGIVPKASKESAKEKEKKEEKDKATKEKSGSPSGSEAGNGGNGNGAESGSDWEKDLQRELEATPHDHTDALGDDILEKEILEQLEAERAAAKK